MNTHDEALAKFARPHNRHIYPRTSLFSKLDDLMFAQGVWVCSPPGSGKTTLLSSYLRASNRPSLWYQIDDGDSDVAAFFWHMRLAAKKIAPRSYSQLDSYSTAYQGSLIAFAARFFEKLFASLPPNFLIVLDDFHLSNNEAALDSVIVQAISSMPQHGNLVVISREQPSPRFCRLLGNEMIQMIGWDDLRLTTEEVRGIGLQRQPGHSVQCLEHIAARIDGWATGLIFHLQNSYAHNCDDILINTNGHEALFGYFANEVLEKQDRESRSVLMQMALFPSMTQDMSRRLTCSDRAIPLLKWLHQRNNFVELQMLKVPTYRFHPMFRDFLLDQLEQNFPPAELQQLKHKAAALLEQSGFRSAARGLYVSVSEWSKVVELIQVDAPVMFYQGQIRSLEKNISELPEEVIAENAWLSYWLGATRMFLDATGAHQYFTTAFHRFQASDDSAGSLAAWSGAVNSLLAEWGDVKSLDKWIEPGERLMSADAPPPKEAQGAQAVVAMCAALSICRPYSPDLEKYISKTHELVMTNGDRTFRLMGCNLLMIFYAWRGELTRMQILVDTLRPGMEEGDVSDAHQVMWAAACGWFDLVWGNLDQCLEKSVNALKLAEKCGVHMFDYKFYGMATQASLLLNRSEEAQVYIGGYLKVIPRKANLLHFHARLLSAWQAWLTGNNDLAREQLNYAEHFLESAGSAAIIAAKTDIAAAILHFEAGETNEGQDRLGNAERTASATDSAWLQYHCHLLRANFESNAGNQARCLQFLRIALETGRSHGLVRTDWWDAPMMSRLCELALVNHIEPEYARHIIDQSGLRPASDSVASAVWPWPVMIEVLGQFKLTVDGNVVSGESAKQKKVLELLKLLIALGGKQVAAERLADMLWPDADGDNARNALKTTVHRLRKLLGVPEALELKDKCLSLCAQHCWVDAFVFTRLARTSHSSGDRLSNLKQALGLYKGPLMAAEEAPWIIPARTQLQKTAHEAVMELGVRYEARHKWGKAIRMYRKELDMDPVDEQVWRHLMQCYQQSGRNEDALMSYQQCCDELKVHLARKPSAKTKLLAESINHA